MAVTVTRTSTLFTDSDSDGVADPGDIVLVHILVQNTNATDILNLKVYDTQNGLTITDTGTVKITPVAFDDHSAAAPLTIVGNTPYVVTASALLGNDVDPDGPEASLTISSFTNLNHVAVNDLGGGNYQIVPETGYQGVASFDYFVTDAQGLTSVSTGRVHILVSGQIWYVDANGSAATGDGSYLKPFTDFTKLNDDGTGAAGTFGPADNVKGDDDVDGVNDTIFVYDRGPTAYNSGITLENGQKLYGDGHDTLVVNNLSIGASSANTAINHSSYGVTLATGNTVQGIDLVGASGATVAIRDGGTGVGNLTISDVAIGGQGQAVDIDQGGSLAVTLNSVSTTGSSGPVDAQGTSGAIDLAGTGGTFTVTGATTITGSHAGGGIDITASSALTASFQGAITVNTGAQTAINFSSGNSNSVLNLTGSSKNIDTTTATALNFTANPNSSVTISGGGLDVDTTGGTGLNFTNTTLTITGDGNSISTATGAIILGSGTIGAGGLDFDSLSATGTTSGSAISLSAVTGGALNSDSTTIAGATAHGVSITGGSSNVTLGSGSIGGSTSTSGRNVLIDGGTGSFDFNGTLNRSTDGNVIEVKNKTGGTVQFDGAVNVSGGGDGITLTSNTGATINFTNVLTLNTSASGTTAFNATGGGTVSSSNASSTINSGSGIGLNVVNTNIGAADLNFTSVNVNGAANGIILNNTGSAGGLTITGAGTTNASGGTIQNTTGRGIDIQNAVQIKISNVTLTNAGTNDLDATNGGLSTGDNLDTNAAIHLVNVTNVTLDNVDITGGAEQGINGNNVANFNLLNSTITNVGNAADEDNIHFYNMSGTSSIVNTVLTHNSGGGDDNLNLQMQSGNLDLSIIGGSAVGIGGGVQQLGSGYLFGIRGTAVANINFEGASSTNNASGGIVADVFDSATMNLRVNNTTSSGNNDQISVSAGDDSKVDLEITNSTLSSVASADFGVINLLGSAFDNGFVFDARIHNNIIDVANGLPTDAIQIFNAGGGVMNVAITNNDIDYGGTQRAILIQSGQDGAGLARVTITGNSIDMTNASHSNPAILAQSAVTHPEGEGASLDLNIGGAGALANTFIHSGGATIAAGDIRVRQRFDGNVNLDGFSGTAFDDAGVIAYLNARNNEVNPATATSDSGGGLGGASDGVGPGWTGAASPTFITVTVSAASVAEDGATNLTYTFTRSGSTAGSLVASFSITGTATAGTDFTVTGATTFANGTGLGTVTFAAGSATATVTVDPTADAAAEADESIVVDVGNSATANGSFARAVITNNDGTVFMQMAEPAPGQSAGENQPLQGQDVDTAAAAGGQPGNAGTGSGPNGGSNASGGQAADDGILSQAELDQMVEAAIGRWAAAGATAAQIEAMRSVDVSLADMMGVQIGSAGQGVIRIDNDAAGHGWFVDTTPGDDSEFTGSGTRLFAAAGTGAAGKVDLLTVLVHELGHQIGLEDDYSSAHGVDAMYGFMDVGERRLPAAGDAARADGHAPTHESFLLAPVADIGTLPAGKSVDIQYQATIDSFTNQVISPLSNTATAKGDNIADTNSNTNVTVVDTLTLGDRIFIDANENGVYDAGEGVNNVALTLFADNGTGPGSVVGEIDANDTQLATTITIGGGLYSFANLAPGEYIVRVDASNFAAAAVLNGKSSVIGGADPDDNVDNDDNGIAAIGGSVASKAITLSYNHEGPNFSTTIPGVTGDDTNNTLDFGFFTPNAAPVFGALNGDTATYYENGAPIAIDVGQNATVTDGDSANFDGGSLTLSVNGSTGDRISWGPGTSFDGDNKVFVGATHIGTLSTNGHQIAISLNSNANAANIQTLVRSFLFDVSTDTPAAGTRTFTFTLVDGDGNDGGLGNDTGTASTTITVVPVSDAPSGADRAGSGLFDSAGAAYAFTVADFATGFSDTNDSPANSFSAVKITTLPSAPAGTIYFDSNLSDATPAVAIAAGDIFTAQDLTDGKLTFVGAPNSGGTAMSFTFQVIDNGNTDNGGVVMDPTPNTFSTTIVASNSAPVLDLDGDNSVAPGTGFASSYVEGGVAAVGDSDVKITDADSGDDVIRATITITNSVAGDLLSVGTLPATVTVDPSSTATVLKLVAAAGTNAADFEAAIEAVQFQNSGNDPTVGGTNTSRTITVTVNDGTSESAAATATVSVTGTNDSPDGADASITAAEDSFRTLSAADFGFSDPDSADSMSAVTITAVNGSGQLYYDADGTAGAGAPAAVASFPQTYTVADLTAGKVSYRAPADANGSALATIDFQVVDNAGAGNSTDPVGNILTVNVTAVNDAPVLTTASPISATEQTAVAILPAGSVVDVELDALNNGNGNYAGAQFSVNRNTAASTDDIFTLVAGPNFTVDGINLKTTGGQIFGQISANNPGLIVISFNSSQAIATSALVDEVIQSVRYTNISDNPPASVDLAVGLTDGSTGGGQGTVIPGQTLDVNVVTVNIAGTNDAPVLDLNGAAAGSGTTLAFSEGNGVTPIAPDATVSDIDSADFAGGTLVVDLTKVGTGDYLSILEGNGITIDNGAQKILYNGVEIATYAITNLAGTYTYTFNSAATAAAVQALVRQVSFANQNDNQLSGDRTVTYTLSDGDGGTGNVATATVSVTAVDDAAVAQDDSVNTPENAIGTGNLFANNASGPDFDAEGNPFSVTQITVGLNNYAPGTVIDLPTGAKLTVNSDGTYSYDPNGSFNTLTDSSSGAVNTSATDTFSYTVTGGDTAIVTMRIDGVAGPGDLLKGDSGDNTITGTPQTDLFRLQQGGNDTVYGLAGIDSFFFGAALTAADKVDGGADRDQITLQGDYATAPLTLGTGVVSVENMVLLSGTDTRYDDDGTHSYSYNITSVNENVAAGEILTVDGGQLKSGENFTFNGSAELDGAFRLYGGLGVDNLTGGSQSDQFLFNAGRWGASDIVNGGAARDQLALRGDYAITFGAGQITSIENLLVLSGRDVKENTDYDYSLTMNDGNVAAGVQMTVDAGQLRETEHLTFNGTAETNGSFRVFGGAGVDDITGSQNADIIVGRGGGDNIYGLGGDDVFRYDSVSDSPASGDRDGIQDFTLGDVIDLSRIDANILLEGDQAFNFIDGNAFSGNAGELRFQNNGGNIWLIQADIDGDKSADLEIFVLIPDSNPITVGDFIL